MNFIPGVGLVYRLLESGYRPCILRRSASYLSTLPSEAVSDKIAMSAFSGTLLNMALCDLGLDAFAICGIATEVGIEPTVPHGADLGYIPVVVAEACGAGEEAAGRRSLESLAFAGDSFVTDVATIGPLLSW